MTTKIKSNLSGAVTAAFLVTAACRGDLPFAGSQIATSGQCLIGPNGLQLNGLQLNGLSYNGLNYNGLNVNGALPNGSSLQGTQLQGTQLNCPDEHGPILGFELSQINVDGVSLSNVGLNGTELSGTDANGHQLGAVDFTGAHLVGLLSDGITIKVRIDAVELNPIDEEIFLYAVSGFSSQNGRWQPLCGNDTAGQPIKATALAGRWNYEPGVPGVGSHIADHSLFTFACEHSALEKCVNWGYKPWKSDALASLHQACIRMVRADYCGDGTAYTVNGTPIDFYDYLRIQVDDAPLDWMIDAEWTPDGASCIANVRHPDQVPSCYSSLYDAQCGDVSHFGANRALLINKIAARNGMN